MGSNAYRAAAWMLGMCLALLCVPAFAADGPGASNAAVLRQLLAQPEESIDLARAKVTIDRMVDPSVDAEGTLRQLDQWAAKIRSRFPAGASNKVKANILVSTLYEPGPWNGQRPFGYDYTDPYGKDIKKSLLSTYLATRKGQCVVMPTAVVLLGQKLGLPMTMTTVPYHLVVKYGDEERGEWTNLDATSGLFHDDGGYIQALNISSVALKAALSCAHIPEMNRWRCLPRPSWCRTT